MPRRLVSPRGLVTLAAALVVGLTLAWTTTAHDARGSADPNALRRAISAGKAREQSLGSAIARLGRLERQTAREVAILDRRLADAQAQLNAAQARLAATTEHLGEQRARLQRLRQRLAQSRHQLEQILRDQYMAGSPDLVTVVLDAHGFADLLERMDFLHRIQDSDTQIVDLVRSARADARHQTTLLSALQAKRQAVAADVLKERNALAGMQAAAQQRRAALAQARAARIAALSATRANRRSAERTLTRLLAQRAREAQLPGPGGPWAIPWAIVQCESGGQNLPPNSAGASGYYQMMPATWRGLGGSTPQAYLAPKSEQDRLAAKLWNHGAGASNWVCAALVGVI